MTVMERTSVARRRRLISVDLARPVTQRARVIAGRKSLTVRWRPRAAQAVRACELPRYEDPVV